MDEQQRSYWRCNDRHCEISRSRNLPKDDATNAVCVCGFPMHREQLPHVFAYLDFLRNEIIVVNGAGQEREQ